MGLASSKYTLFTALGEGRLRTAILSKKYPNSNLCSHYSTKDQVVIQCEGANGRSKTLFASIYMAHDMETPTDETKSLMAYALARKLNIVIGGDANCSSQYMGL